METRKEDRFWKWVNRNVTRILEELKEDSVANNPRKPVDCCNPPVGQDKKGKLKAPNQ